MSAPGIIIDSMEAIEWTPELEPLYRPTPGMLARAREDPAYAEKLRSVVQKKNEIIRKRNTARKNQANRNQIG
jgi:hypothetical protein